MNYLILYTSLFVIICRNSVVSSNELIVFTVATNETDGFRRFIRSANMYDVKVQVLGMGQQWKGGDVKNYAGGGHKINLLKNELNKLPSHKNQTVLFTDSYDVLFIGAPDKILMNFKSFDVKILFSAEPFCWPDSSLESKYPEVKRGRRFLNSGGFIGYVPELKELLNYRSIEDHEDDQLFYTQAYLNESLREKLSMALDHTSQIFQTLNGASGDIELRFRGEESYLQNTLYNTAPLVLHGNGHSKLFLNSLGNYLADAWNPKDGCIACLEGMVNFAHLSSYPQITMAIFMEQATPFLEEFFQYIKALDYPKKSIDLLIHNKNDYNLKQLKIFLHETGELYHSVSWLEGKEWHARNDAIEKCIEANCDLYFSIDSTVHLDNSHTLQLLVEQNRSVIAPLLYLPYTAWANFWGELTRDGFYARSSDYIDIVNRSRRGLWNVPYISSAYLIQGHILRDSNKKPNFIFNLLDADMAFCQNMRDNDVFMFVSNRVDFGHLVDPTGFETTHLHNELYEVKNRWDWEKRYLHPNYSTYLSNRSLIEEPCPDVFWFPLFSKRYCIELVEEMENYGQWSSGSNEDSRLEGGYENVPTRDIHMKQIGMEAQFLQLLKLYVQPVQEKVYEGYSNEDPKAIMNFVVRYRPDEQPSLRPHHDASTYTINVALNQIHLDYEGGGCRFIRYNCSVVETRMGWSMMNPGRLTHYHEGLSVIRGTRYILVSFVDP